MRLARQFILAFGLVAATASTALALPPGIYVTDHDIDTTSPTFEKDLKKAQKTSITKQGSSWKLYFVAYLKKAAGATELNIVFYDIAAGKKEAPSAYPVGTQPSAKIIKSDVELTEEQNFKSGHKYNVRITRLVNGHEDVFASTLIELK